LKKSLILFIVFFCLLSSAFSQQNYWQQRVDYKIDVSLNDKDNSLNGFVKMDYYNNSPDTLHFIWIHLWPNAYKNDRTAFSDQLLENGRTDFYFSDNDNRGYINRLNFKVDGIIAVTEDHPIHQDIVKIILPQPLAPNENVKIETPFHVKLPFNFSRGGHVGQSYQITQWYPKPAVYDKKGWHPIPYLDQGEFYSEFGNYEVQITLPQNYVVAATGELQSADEKDWLVNHPPPATKQDTVMKYVGGKKTMVIKTIIPSSSKTKTLIYKQNNVHDFAWFADKTYLTNHDTLQLASGRIIDVYSFYHNKSKAVWANSIPFIKKTILTRSKWLGEYPYNVVSAAEAKMGFNGGMEYPTITSISPMKSEYELESTIEHEVGHNWNYGILATNERDEPWMDEGINTYYDNWYISSGQIISKEKIKTGLIAKRLPDNVNGLLLRSVIEIKKDQPIETASEKFSELNYFLSAYIKTGEWMKLLQDDLGKEVFDTCMHAYYNQWKFKHPYPEDFKKIVQQTCGKNVDSIFSLLNKKGSLTTEPVKKNIRLAFLFNLKETDKYNYISLAPAIGYNNYDNVMIGAVIHNYQLPLPKFHFVVVSLYATGSKQLNGIGRAGYSWYPDNRFSKIEFDLSASHFSTNQYSDTNNNKVFENFYKIVPSFQFHFKHDPRSSIASWFDIRTYIIGEKTFNKFGFISGSDSSVSYPIADTQTTRYVNQVSFNLDNNRVLYPYNYQLKLQQGKGFYRFDATGNYFFNYTKGGGMKIRLFASKFGFLGNDNNTATLYKPKLLGANGLDDYTYSNYFIGRSAYTGTPGQGIAPHQIMVQGDGGLKVRLDQFGYLQGQSADWVAAMNFNSTIPKGLLPLKLPISVFFDIGTYAEAWGNNPQTSKFLYVGGLQVSLLKNVVNIYLPFIYSNDFSDTFNEQGSENTFLQKVTFSIDVQNISLRKLIPQLPL
jgi:hypothetical protein